MLEIYIMVFFTNVTTALEALVEKRVTGFPVIDDDWKLVKVSIAFAFFSKK